MTQVPRWYEMRSQTGERFYIVLPPETNWLGTCANARVVTRVEPPAWAHVSSPALERIKARLREWMKCTASPSADHASALLDYVASTLLAEEERHGSGS